MIYLRDIDTFEAERLVTPDWPGLDFG
jgi:hypothetical protein